MVDNISLLMFFLIIFGIINLWESPTSLCDIIKLSRLVLCHSFAFL